MTSKFQIGDRVAYKAAFLRSIMDYSHASASRRGTVVALTSVSKDLDLVDIEGWNGRGERNGRVLSSDLILADRIHLEPN